MSRVVSKKQDAVRPVVGAVAGISLMILLLLAFGLTWFPAFNGSLTFAYFGGLCAAIAAVSFMCWVVTTHHLRIRWMHGRAMLAHEELIARVHRADQVAYLFGYGALTVVLLARAEVGNAPLPTVVLVVAAVMFAASVVADMRSVINHKHYHATISV